MTLEGRKATAVGSLYTNSIKTVHYGPASYDVRLCWWWLCKNTSHVRELNLIFVYTLWKYACAVFTSRRYCHSGLTSKSTAESLWCNCWERTQSLYISVRDYNLPPFREIYAQRFLSLWFKMCKRMNQVNSDAIAIPYLKHVHMQKGTASIFYDTAPFTETSLALVIFFFLTLSRCAVPYARFVLYVKVRHCLPRLCFAEHRRVS